MNKIELYKTIDDFFAKGIDSAKKEIAQSFIDVDFDAKDYFFFHVPIDWINWLDKNGFFEVLNKASEDKTRYSFKMPELAYLLRVVESKGDEEKVIEIMNNVDCATNFNPEVIDQFLWIAQKLSVPNLINVIPKIQKENWVLLMKDFRDSGYSYEPIVKKLVEANEYNSLLLLTKAMLIVNNEKSKDDYSDKYFYLSDIHETGIFEALSALKDHNAEDGIKLISEILTDLVDFVTPGVSIFKVSDKYNVYDLDFFDVKNGGRTRRGFKEDIKSLLETFVSLLQSSLSISCETDARRIYNIYVKILPDSQTLWRVKLFAMSRCPMTFADDIKKEINKIFHDSEKYGYLLSGTEYLKTLQIVFPTWSGLEQKEYVQKILGIFKKLLITFPKEPWHKELGLRILSIIAPSLTLDEKQKVRDVFKGELDETFEPKPDISEIRSGSVHDLSPVSFDNEKYKDISKVIEDLKGDLSPEKLKEKYKDDDFLRPRNARGVGDALTEDMKKRMDDYLIHASEFLSTDIHAHYTYSFLRGVEEYLRDKKELKKDGWDNLFLLMQKTRNPLQKNSDQENGEWLGRWSWVEKTVADLLKVFTTKNYSALFIDKRTQIFDLITYLLEKDASNREYEKGNSSDLYTTAINTSRGIAFETLVNFIYQDAKEELKPEIINLYENVLTKTSLPIRFLMGRYLASFYYRDKRAIQNLFERLFPRDKEKHEEFFAVWEGYLSSSLYKELFEDLREYYLHALSIVSSNYPERKRFRDIDTGIGTHLALAFAYFDNVQYTKDQQHPLLEKLWSGIDVKKQKEFISFLGNGIISRDSDETQEVDLQKLKDLWIFLLEKDLNSEVYSAFGFWVNSEKDIFGDYAWLAEMMARTLGKSNGKMDWDHGLQTRLPEFAVANPEKTIVILEKYLLNGILGEGEEKWFYLDDKKIDVFQILYKEEPAKTTRLINALLEKGGRSFWSLKDIVVN